MTAQNKKYLKVDVKAYHPFRMGIPILAFLVIIATVAFVAIGIYEYCL